MANAFVAVFGYDGTGSASTTAASISPVKTMIQYVIFQNDPASTTNIKVGVTSSPAVVLAPGNSITIWCPNTSNVFFQAVSGTPTYNWCAFQ